MSGGAVVRTARGSSIYVEQSGDGPPVLALHGIGGGAYFFHGLAARLGSSARVIAIDLPGTGRSGTQSPMAFDDWVVDLSDLIDREIAQPVVVIGHSLGTILALHLWRQMPERLRGLMFVGGLPCARAVVRERLRERAAAIAADGIAGWGPAIAAANFGSRAMVERPEVIGLYARLIEGIDVPSYLRSIELLLAADATRLVATVTAPCLSISGAEDGYAPPDEVAAFVEALGGPAESIVLPGVGHLPFFEAPEEFAAAVRGFLQRLDVPSVH